MYVIKRNNKMQEYNKEKLCTFISNLSLGLNITYGEIVLYTNTLQIQNGISTDELLNFISNDIYENVTDNVDYSFLASRIMMRNIEKKSLESFGKYILFFKDILSKKFIEKYNIYSNKIERAIRYDRNDLFDFIGIKVLSTYLLKYDNMVENPQYLFMRVAMTVGGNEIEEILQTYDYLSLGLYIHGSPTLFKSGLEKQQLCSCFLLQMDDSIEGIFKCLGEAAVISKEAGGIGVNVTNIRSKGAMVSKINKSNGIVGLLKLLNDTATYVNQSGMRPGAIAVYMEPWHPDIYSFIKAKKFLQNEEFSAKDLFYGLWIPDLFMKRLIDGSEWSLIDPASCPDLCDKYGEEFDKLYIDCERKKSYVKQIDPRELWNLVIDTQIETGGPYIMFKDTCNRQSNQNNLGTIKCSNLCTEIIEFSSTEKTAVCNVASINVRRMIRAKKFDFNILRDTVKVVTRNLDNIIDVTYYPSEKSRLSNIENRPIGIGVQGLANLFQELGLSYEDDEAKILNKNIFETIYYSSLEESCNMAIKKGRYTNYNGSLLDRGILHYDFYDMSNYKFINNFDNLRKIIKINGVRNSLLVAPMPTATTSQILSNYDCVEPWIGNIYYRKILTGNIKIVNNTMIKELKDIWTNEIKRSIIDNNGSIQHIDAIDNIVKRRYKTVYEIDPNILMSYYIDRAPFVDQSQSMNVYISHYEPDKYNKINKLLIKAWKSKLKTGLYYLRIEEKKRSRTTGSKIACDSCSA